MGAWVKKSLSHSFDKMNKEETIKKLSIDKGSSILEAIKLMDEYKKKLLLVFKDKAFYSLLSIGDIQRAILKGKALTEPIEGVLRENIRLAYESESFEEIKARMLKFRMEMLPVLNDQKEIVNIYHWDDVFAEAYKRFKGDLDVPVVIMAGGKGTRLKPITNIIPKALVPIDEKPIVEVIIDRFKLMGASNFYMTVNYKSEMIESYFNQVEKDYNLSYVLEDKPLGTAGSLYMLKEKLQATFFVTNCDIIIEEDYSEIYKYHKKEGNELTLVAALKHYPIPYGVLETKENGVLTGVSEKPELTFQVNSGMYILEPELLKEIPENEFFHITHLMEKILERGGKVGVFPVSEGSWMDIGVWSEYNRTRKILSDNIFD